MSLLEVQGLVKRFGSLLVTDHLDLDVRPGEIHAVIGPNGAGKTTLINQLSGELQPSEGRIRLDGRDITHASPDQRALAGLARSYQITSVFPGFTVLQNAMLSVQAHSGHSFSFWRPAFSDPALRAPALAELERVGLLAHADTPVGELAHGASRQLEIAMALATRPKVLLLDEPMAGMSQHESAEMARLLTQLKGEFAILLVEHDMDIVFSLADRISVLVYGRCIARGTADEIRNDAEVRTAYLGDEEEAP